MNINEGLKLFEPVNGNDGYRPNVGIIISNDQGQVFWARRITGDGWQFPQGGLRSGEPVLEGMYRELEEETGLKSSQVELIGHTNNWLRYDLPKRFLRAHEINDSKGKAKVTSFKGQKQIWFMLHLKGSNVEPNLACTNKPEFDDWRWVNYWYALDHIVSFKRSVYQRAMKELEAFLPVANH